MGKWKDMIGPAFSLAIVGYVINLAMGRTLGNKHGYDVDPNQVILITGKYIEWLHGLPAHNSSAAISKAGNLNIDSPGLTTIIEPKNQS